MTLVMPRLFPTTARFVSRRRPYPCTPFFDDGDLFFGPSPSLRQFENEFGDMLRLWGDDLPLKKRRSACHSMSRDADDFKTRLNVQGYSPEDVEVAVDAENRMVTITAKKEDSGRGFSMMKQFKRSFAVPESCDIEKLKVNMERGRMTIQAPNKTEAIENEEKQADKEATKEIKVNVDEAPTEGQTKEIEVNKEKTPESKDDTAIEKVEETKLASRDNFKASVDMSGFDPEHVKVEMSPEGRIAITAEKEVTEEKENGAAAARMRLCREFWLDKDLFDLDSLKSGLNKDGLLLLEAQRKKVGDDDSNEVREIPVIAIE